MKCPIKPARKTDPILATKYVRWWLRDRYKAQLIKGSYIRASTLFYVKCKNHNHPIFKINWNKLHNGQWCKLCHLDSIRGKYKITIDNCKKFADSIGWNCLSDSYNGPKALLLWLCPNGHKRRIKYHNLRSGKRCAVCVGNDPVTAGERFLTACKAKELVPLEQYKGANKKIRLKCKKCNMKWQPVAASISQGTGCPNCAKKNAGAYKKKNITWLRNLVMDIGYRLISNSYTNAATKVWVNCNKGHPDFQMTPNALQQGNRCQRCFRERQKVIPESRKREEFRKIKKICKENKWKLLSLEYQGSTKKLHVRCKCGFEWYPLKSQLERGSGCQNCSSGLGERLTRVALEFILKVKFLSASPDWLKNNESGRRLRLDGYNEEMQLAFEHQGRQHEKQIPMYHLTQQKFKNQQKRDQIKKRLCEENGIRLIEVLEVPAVLPVEMLVEYIEAKLKQLKIDIPKRPSDLMPDWNLAYVSRSDSYIETANRFAKQNNWTLVSKIVLSTTQKIEFICPKHSTFYQSIHKLRVGRGCAKCGRKRSWAIRRERFQQ